MQFSSALLANASNGSGHGFFGALFWLFLVAAVIWLLIWRLLKPGASGGVFDDSEDAIEPEPSSRTEPAPQRKTSPVPSKVLPSKAFTLWTKPAPAPEAAPTPEAAPQSTLLFPSRAFTIWTKPGSKPAKAESKPVGESKGGGESGPNDSDANAVPELDTATEEEAAAQFQADLDSGSARQDAKLGILYHSAPDDADDLKEIKGVAKVLEGKLHEFGVYKFKQIAFWTDTAVAEFAQRLTFKDRIYRDDWIAQAKDLHEKKYGEKL